MLPSSILAGPTNNDGSIPCWAGSGRYLGEQDVFQLGDFTSGGKDRVAMILDMRPFFNEVADLLGKPKAGNDT